MTAENAIRILVVIAALIAIVETLNVLADSEKAKQANYVEYAKAGLQQCAYGFETVWQRECK